MANEPAAHTSSPFAGDVGNLHIEAARSGWQAEQPPASGWTDVTLPDDWAARWPGFDGVVWYRVVWDDPSANRRALALMIDYVNMAGAVYLNGTLLDTDNHLVEPLSRAWNTPRYLRLPAPLLRAGTNTLLVRVSGLAAYQPGLGRLTLGDPATVQPLYGHTRWMRQDLQQLSLAVTITLGGFFLVIWLMRRKESVYGWFSLQSFAWWCNAYNQIAASPWPFQTTDSWEALASILFVVYSTCFTIFLVRFCGRRLPRVEATLWILVACQTLVMLAAPHAYIMEVRAAIALIPSIIFLAACLTFIGFAVRSRRADQLALAVCMVFFIFADIHDMLVFLGVLDSNFYYSALTALVEMMSMALVLAWRFVVNLRRIEHFNEDLSARIAGATEELRATLRRQYDLEVTNARLSERLNLAHDLHDGLGGTLVNNIAAIEYAPHDMSSRRFLAILKELRDDLRIIIDTASVHQSGSRSLAGLVAPLRHRLMRSFESRGVECRWQLPELTGLHLSNARCIDVLRLLQEGLTNVLRHSGASRVDVELREDGPALRLVIADNGCGFDTDAIAAHEGTGMRSMHARAQRLGGVLQVQSGRSGTALRIDIPRSDSDASDGAQPAR